MQANIPIRTSTFLQVNHVLLIIMWTLSYPIVNQNWNITHRTHCRTFSTFSCPYLLCACIKKKKKLKKKLSKRSYRDALRINSGPEEGRLPGIDILLTLTGQLQLTVVLVHVPVIRTMLGDDLSLFINYHFTSEMCPLSSCLRWRVTRYILIWFKF